MEILFESTKNENQKVKESLAKEIEKSLKFKLELTESEKRLKVIIFTLE